MPNLLPSSPQLIMLLAMGLLIMLLWRRSNRYFGRGGKAHEPPYRVSNLQDDRDLALADAPPELTRWQVEMYELSREMKGELDTKMALLQILIRKANEASDRLERAVALAEQRGLDTSPATSAKQPGTPNPATDFPRKD
jgi:hypothetical protein